MAPWTQVEYDSLLAAVSATFGAQKVTGVTAGSRSWKEVADTVGTGRSLNAYHSAYLEKPKRLAARGAQPKGAPLPAGTGSEDASGQGSSSGIKRERDEVDELAEPEGESDEDEIIVVEGVDRKPDLGKGKGKMDETPVLPPAAKKIKVKAASEAEGAPEEPKNEPRFEGFVPHEALQEIQVHSPGKTATKMQSVFQLAQNGDKETENLVAQLVVKLAADWGKEASN